MNLSPTILGQIFHDFCEGSAPFLMLRAFDDPKGMSAIVVRGTFLQKEGLCAIILSGSTKR